MTSAGAPLARASATPDAAARLPESSGGRAAACRQGLRWQWLWPAGLVAAAAGWNLVNLRALTRPVTYGNDATVHEQMVRFAATQLRAGHLPLSTWFPYLGEGSPQFLHYQSLPAMLTGALGLLTGPDAAFRWTLYLLVSLWPVSIYLAARAFGIGRSAAAASAAMAPFLVSVPGVGYEQQAYLWKGFGVWTQLWAMWTLPLAWGLSWRAIRGGRGYFAAILLTALTIALHFETGYLALVALLIWPLAAGRPLLTRLRRASVLLGGSLLASAWVIVPLLAQRPWAAVNEVLAGTGDVNGYGARQVMDWLVTGQLLDSGRLPVVTVLAAAGLVLAWLAWTCDASGRALLAALAVCLLLSFGRTTFGPLVQVIPGSADIFFRRFLMGVQLAALLLAGRGAAWLARRGALLAGHGVRRASRWLRPAGRPVPRWLADLAPLAAVVAAAAVLAPAWLQLGAYDREDSAAITAQQHADAMQGAQLDRLIAAISARGGGRVYAGMASNWGASFTVGTVPVYQYLESRDVDEVGYTLRTASLMTGPEYYFDERQPADYRLFAVRYLILPAGQQPPVHARPVLTSGPYSLWAVSGTSYIQAGQITGGITADRADLGTRSLPVLRSGLAASGAYLSVRYGSASSSDRLPRQPSAPPAGAVSSQRARLSSGQASATLRMRRAGIAVLSASYDPGWTATVNGRPQPTLMIAPALTGVAVPAGTDHVVFRYRGYGDYPQLLALSGLTLIAAAAGPALARRARRRRESRA